MPNGGHICCHYCTHNKPIPDLESVFGRCEVHGIRANPFLLCRNFIRHDQSQDDALSKWPMLKEMKPGIVYEIDNDIYKSGNPRPASKNMLEKL